MSSMTDANAGIWPEAVVGKVAIGEIGERGYFPVTIGRRTPKHFYATPDELAQLVLASLARLAGTMDDAQRATYASQLTAALEPPKRPARKARTSKAS